MINIILLTIKITVQYRYSYARKLIFYLTSKPHSCVIIKSYKFV